MQQTTVPPVVFLDKFVDLLDPDPSKYTLVGKGGVGCVFKGPVDKVVRIFKLNRNVSLETLRATMHEVIIGNMVHGLSHWVQTVGYAIHTGPIPVLSLVKDAECTFDNDTDVHVIVVQEVAGEVDLKTYLQRNNPSDTQLRSIAFQLVWALYTASARYGLVHGDLKPQNVMLTFAKTPLTLRYAVYAHSTLPLVDMYEMSLAAGAPMVRIVDLGGAFMSVPGRTVPDLPAESPFCSDAIETSTPIFRGIDSNQTPASDLFALGITLLHMVCSGTSVVLPEQVARNKEAGQVMALVRAVGQTITPAQQLSVMQETGVEIAGLTPDLIRQRMNDSSGLLLVQDLLQLDPAERLKMGIPRPPPYGICNALLHPYFETYHYAEVQPLPAEEASIVLSTFRFGYLAPHPNAASSVAVAYADHVYAYYARHTESGLESTRDRLAAEGGGPAAAISTVLQRLVTDVSGTMQRHNGVTMDHLREYVQWMHEFAELVDSNKKLSAALQQAFPPEKGGNKGVWYALVGQGKGAVAIRETFLVQETKTRRIPVQDASVTDRTTTYGGYSIDGTLNMDQVYRILTRHVNAMYGAYQIINRQAASTWYVSDKMSAAECKGVLRTGIIFIDKTRVLAALHDELATVEAAMENENDAEWIGERLSNIEKQLQSIR